MSNILNNTSSLQAVLEALQTKAAGGEQATPVISVSSNGLITATAGTKSSTHQLAFQAAKTITPGTTSQVAVSSGYFTGGNVMVAGDSNLVAGNIKSGVSIFGVNGTYVGDGSEADVLIAMTMSEYTNSRVSSIGKGVFAYTDLKSVNFSNVKTIGSNAFTLCSSLKFVNFPECTTIGSSAFHKCSSLTSINFPKCTTIGNAAFSDCSKLTSINFPVCTTIGRAAFSWCSKLTSVSFPKCATIGMNAFSWCSSLTSVNFPECTTIGSNAFASCSSLTSVSFPKCATIGNAAFASCKKLSQFYLTGSSVCKLSNSNAFSSTPYAGYSSYFSGTPYIYVPASLLTSYQTATNWTYFSSRFVAYDGGGDTGNLITFTIDDTQYQAEEGMTWGEWVESEYNTDGFFISENAVGVEKENTVFTVFYNNESNLKNSEIIQNTIYTLNTPGGSN